MPKPKRGPRLGAGPAHQKLMLANQAGELFRHGRITTTETKARMLRPYAEKLITKAKRGDLHARRQVLAQIRDRDVVAYLFEEIAPRFAERPGGYTRILKLGPRPGDNAPMAIIELVDRTVQGGEERIEEAKVERGRGLFGRRRRRRPEPAFVPALEDRADLGDEDEDDLGDGDATPPDVAAQPTAADRAAQEDASDAPSDVPTDLPPEQDPSITDERRDPRPGAGDTTGG